MKTPQTLAMAPWMVSLAVLLGTVPVTQANMVINGDFEQPSLPLS